MKPVDSSVEMQGVLSGEADQSLEGVDDVPVARRSDQGSQASGVDLGHLAELIREGQERGRKVDEVAFECGTVTVSETEQSSPRAAAGPSPDTHDEGLGEHPSDYLRRRQRQIHTDVWEGR